MKRIVILTTLFLALPGLALAAGFAKVGTFGGQELKIGVSARATGMGSAYTGVADDATAVFWNAAGLVNVRGNEVSLNHVSWAADTKLSTAILAFNPRSIPGTFAFSVRSFWMDPQLVRTAYNPEGTGETFDSGTTTFGLTYARFFTDKFSAGFTMNYLHMGLAETAVNSGAFDERESKLPVVFKVGASFNAFKTERQYLLVSLEFQHPADNIERANVGTEWGLNNIFFARAGYHIEYDTDGLAFGFGAGLPTGQNTRMQADYSAVDMSALGYTHRLSLSITY